MKNPALQAAIFTGLAVAASGCSATIERPAQAVATAPAAPQVVIVPSAPPPPSTGTVVVQPAD